MNLSVLRILDANANRAREALRVIEDYARFQLNNEPLSGDLKLLRHDFAAAISPWARQALLLRDTPGDVGTAIKTQSEFEREDMAAVVTAAGKRLGEALRTIEEYLKTVSPAAAAQIELMRYAFYDIELRVARTLRPSGRFTEVRLYVLITESICKRPWQEVAEAAIAGGADCLQLREKNLEAGELLRRAKLLVAMCRKGVVICLINDRPDIALLADADGVHVGQDDLPAIEARKLLGPEKIVGVSTHTIEQAKQAVLDGADYIGVGPVFRSSTKTREILPGLDFARQVASEINLPAVAIAGITEENIDAVLATGVQAVAVTAAVAASDDPRASAERLKNRLSVQTVRKSSGGTDILVGPAKPSAHQNLSGNTNTPGGVDILVCPPEPSAHQTPSKKANTPGGADILVCPPRPSAHRTPSTNTNPSIPSEPQFTAYSRRLPHWRLHGAIYFITFRVRAGELKPSERTIILEYIRSGDPKFYTLLAATIMPDHVHVILRPAKGVELSRIMKGTKSATARKLNDLRNVRGILWQDECWDRIMRNQAELDEKLKYCMNNAVKKGLVSDPWDYPWWFYKPDKD